jgi:uncharacterized protein (DUF2345 family)
VVILLRLKSHTSGWTTPRGADHNLAGGQRADAVVHLFEKEGVQVGEVAGDVKRRDLPSAVSEAVVTASEAFQDETALGEGVALAHDVLPGP